MAKYDGEVIETFGNEIPEKLAERVDYRVHRLVVRANNNMTLEQSKVFHLILSRLAEQPTNPVLLIKKEEFFDKVGLRGDDRWTRYRDIFRGLIDKTRLEFYDSEREYNYMGGAVVEVYWPRSSNKPIQIVIGPTLLPYLTDILGRSTLLYLDEIMTFKSDFSLRLYLYFKSWNALNYDDGHLEQNMRYVTDKQLFQLFDLAETAYHNKKGMFRRSDFEKYTIDVACKEISEKTGIRCRVAKKNYGKRGRVLNYVFEWVDFKNSHRGGIDPAQEKFTPDTNSSKEPEPTIFEHGVIDPGTTE